MSCRRAPRGWYCTRGYHHGPCAAWPHWWNLRGWLWMKGG